MDYKTFKNELRNLYSYERELKKIDASIEDLSYLMTGVRGINYSKTPSSPNPEVVAEHRLDMIEDMEGLLAEKQRLTLNITHIYATLSKLNDTDKEIVMQIIVKKVNAEKVANEKGYSRSGIWARIKREIEKL